MIMPWWKKEKIQHYVLMILAGPFQLETFYPTLWESVEYSYSQEDLQGQVWIRIDSSAYLLTVL